MKEFFSSSAFLIALGVTLVIFIFLRVAKNRLQNKMVNAFTEQDYDAYFKLIDSWLSKYIYPRAQREFLKMNAYMATGNHEELMKQMDYFEERKMPPKLLTEICFRMFNYFLGIRDAEGSRRSLELLEKIVGAEKALRNRQMYDIYIKENATHLDEMAKEYEELLNEEDVEPMMFCQLEVMLAYQYYYKGDKVKSKEMFEKGIEHADSEIYKDGLRLVMKDFKL